MQTNTTEELGRCGSACNDVLGHAAPEHDKATGELENSKCEHCGSVFIGGLNSSICGECVAAYEDAMRQDARRAEWHAEMRRDAFGA